VPVGDHLVPDVKPTKRIPESWLPAKPKGRADRRKLAAAGEGREAWLRNSDSVANQAEQLRDPGLSSRNLLLRLSVRFFAGCPARRILVNGLQLERSGSTSDGLGAFDESSTVTCVVLERD